MKIFYLVGSLIMTILVLILAFENIAAMCNMLHFFFVPLGSKISPTFLVFTVSFFGIITGMFYFGLIHALVSKDKYEDEDEDF